ncbi:hypothetical protein EJ08DRAFT_691200 [Tothia fuscella]|uniref:Uncharacterized protein n=1 Tax=Tothia fuscella TaxID=1048955 RepID=A0A9P4P5C6_9PEZI|nr:hypothetical protein EJ08DRAFT_691200 [Tothia fuscella]
MHFHKSFLFSFAAIRAAIASPVENAPNLPHPYWTCTRSSGSTSLILRDYAAAVVDRVTTQVHQWNPTGSGYPSFFYPHHRIDWPNKACNVPEKYYDLMKILVSIPVFEDQHFYEWNTEPAPPPGDMRAVYTYPAKTFCGVLLYVNGGSTGEVALCT